MKNKILLAISIVSFSSLSAQTTPPPGTTSQTQATTLFIANNSPFVFSYEPSTHNYAQEIYPFCFTSIQQLNPFTINNITVPLNQQVGVNLSIFQLQGVTAYNQNLWPSNNYFGPLISNQDYIDFGRTQKWHQIKFYIQGADLGGNIKYLVPDGLNLTPINDYWSIDDSQRVWDQYSGIPSNISNGTTTVVWNTIGSVEFITVI